jgi:hypothetical protein
MPPTPASTLVFAAAMGMLWLGVAPLVTGLVAEMFGTRYTATLLGIAFVMHQVGSSLAAWGGGLVFDVTGSYSRLADRCADRPHSRHRPNLCGRADPPTRSVDRTGIRNHLALTDPRARGAVLRNPAASLLQTPKRVSSAGRILSLFRGRRIPVNEIGRR